MISALDTPSCSLVERRGYFAGFQVEELTVVRAGIAAALEGRAPRLMDVVPKEVYDLVPTSARRRPKAAEEIIKRKLIDTPPNGGRRQRKTTIKPADREAYRLALNNRVGKASRFFSRSYDSSSLGSFTHRVLAFVVDQTGKVRIITQIPAWVRAGISALPKRERTEFVARYSVARSKPLRHRRERGQTGRRRRRGRI
jgi:hypothetical protein